ncbi:M20/M25/M40 family metallo-hydrolase [Geomicrobium sp. JCM 19039]|uniref:M20/M25/M40 family metallo-hydrolase n=1 Tax=Geomicrobium sp. JCM 19039 TaxID=1460636 RepID=UPI000A8E4EDA|nr:M20/M25/M40 family metallo-hydrolase [Geomicrobium sp. JCM 19039]
MTREALKQTITDYAKAHQQTFITISQQIHARPELGNEEVYASAQLSKQLEREGFSVQRNIAGHSTGFIAKKSSEKPGPTVYFLAEYDALPEIGHACGHNIIGTTSVLAAILLGKIIEEIGGTVAVAGTPAEEGGDNGSAKASFVNRGYFDDGDAAIMIHPGKETRVSGHSLAVDPVDYHFHGRTAHASATPEKGINALDSVIQLFNGINALREHLADDIRIHGVIPDGARRQMLYLTTLELGSSCGLLQGMT